MPVRLLNRERRLQVFELSHENFCRSAGRCHCTMQKFHTMNHDPRTGVKSKVEHAWRFPAALSIPSLSSVVQPDAILSVPSVQDAVKSRRLVAQKLQEREEVKVPENKPAPRATKSSKK